MDADYARQILRVGRDATEDDIARAFRSRLRKIHPDSNPESNLSSEEVTGRKLDLEEARDVLVGLLTGADTHASAEQRSADDSVGPPKPFFDPSELDFRTIQAGQVSLNSKTVKLRIDGGDITEDSSLDVPRKTGTFWRMEPVTTVTEDEVVKQRVIAKFEFWATAPADAPSEPEDYFTIKLDDIEARLLIRLKVVEQPSTPKPPPSTRPYTPPSTSRVDPSPPRTPPYGTPAADAPSSAPPLSTSRVMAGIAMALLLLLPFVVGWQRVFVGGVPIEDNNIWMSMWLAVGGAEGWEEADAISKGDCLGEAQTSDSNESDSSAAGSFLPFFILSWLLSLPLFLLIPIGSLALWGGLIGASVASLGDGDPSPKSIVGYGSIPLVIGLLFLALSGLALRGALHFAQCG